MRAPVHASSSPTASSRWTATSPRSREICDLADEFGALVFVDDSHAVGFVGEHGRGTPEFCGVADRVDIYTGTFGKALGGASGGYVVVAARDRRPAAPAGPAVPVLEHARAVDRRRHARRARPARAVRRAARRSCVANAALFRALMTEAGFELLPGEHPIVPVMFGDAALTARIADEMQQRGVYVTAFSFPVVPRGPARIRVQLSAAHTDEEIRRCVEAFVARARRRRRLGVRPGSGLSGLRPLRWLVGGHVWPSASPAGGPFVSTEPHTRGGRKGGMPDTDDFAFDRLRRWPDVEAANLFAVDAADRLLLDTAADELAGGCAPASWSSSATPTAR